MPSAEEERLRADFSRGRSRKRRSRTKPRGRARPAAVTSARGAGSFGDLRGRSKSSENHPQGVAVRKKPAVSRKTAGFQRNLRGELRKWSKEKQNSRSGSRRSASSSSMTAMRTINVRAAASTLKRQSYFIPASYMPKKLTAISQKPCSRSSLERWIGLRSASGGNFLSWLLSKTSTTISSLRTRTLTPGAIRKCADSAWRKSKGQTAGSILKMRY